MKGVVMITIELIPIREQLGTNWKETWWQFQESILKHKRSF